MPSYNRCKCLLYLYDTPLMNVLARPEVECLLMAYTVDLISVLKPLFDFTLKPDVAGTTNWEVLKEAFEDYERSNKAKKFMPPVDRCTIGTTRS